MTEIWPSVYVFGGSHYYWVTDDFGNLITSKNWAMVYTVVLAN